MARARALQQIAQTITTAGEAHASPRASRLYRRALRLLDAQPAAREDMPRAALRDAVRARLAEHGLVGWLRRHPLLNLLRGSLLAIVVTLVIAFVPPVHHFFFPIDLAAGKPWTASSAWPGFPGSGVMSGPVRAEGRFHTLEQVWPAVVVDLQRPTRIHKVVVWNRPVYFRERCLPLALELSLDGVYYRRVAYRRALFDSWGAEFPAQQARYVRLRVDRQSILHLSSVSVY